MTIHRALAELKLLDIKITKQINTMRPIGSVQKGKLVGGIIAIDVFEKNAKSALQSVTDLINRKITIKSAIVESNSVTKITVNDKAMLVADAIAYKDLIQYKKSLLAKLSREYAESVRTIENNNAQVNSNALTLAEQALGKEGIKITDKDAINNIEPYLDNTLFNLVDPLNLKDMMVILDNEIMGFETDIDATLSESNAITTIDV